MKTSLNTFQEQSSDSFHTPTKGKNPSCLQTNPSSTLTIVNPSHLQQHAKVSEYNLDDDFSESVGIGAGDGYNHSFVTPPTRLAKSRLFLQSRQLNQGDGINQTFAERSPLKGKLRNIDITSTPFQDEIVDDGDRDRETDNKPKIANTETDREASMHTFGPHPPSSPSPPSKVITEQMKIQFMDLKKQLCNKTKKYDINQHILRQLNYTYHTLSQQVVFKEQNILFHKKHVQRKIKHKNQLKRKLKAKQQRSIKLANEIDRQIQRKMEQLQLTQKQMARQYEQFKRQAAELQNAYRKFKQTAMQGQRSRAGGTSTPASTKNTENSYHKRPPQPHQPYQRQPTLQNLPPSPMYSSVTRKILNEDIANELTPKATNSIAESNQQSRLFSQASYLNDLSDDVDDDPESPYSRHLKSKNNKEAYITKRNYLNQQQLQENPQNVRKQAQLQKGLSEQLKRASIKKNVESSEDTHRQRPSHPSTKQQSRVRFNLDNLYSPPSSSRQSVIDIRIQSKGESISHSDQNKSETQQQRPGNNKLIKAHNRFSLNDQSLKSKRVQQHKHKRNHSGQSKMKSKADSNRTNSLQRHDEQFDQSTVNIDYQSVFSQSAGFRTIESPRKNHPQEQQYQHGYEQKKEKKTQLTANRRDGGIQLKQIKVKGSKNNSNQRQNLQKSGEITPGFVSQEDGSEVRFSKPLLHSFRASQSYAESEADAGEDSDVGLELKGSRHLHPPRLNVGIAESDSKQKQYKSEMKLKQTKKSSNDEMKFLDPNPRPKKPSSSSDDIMSISTKIRTKQDDPMKTSTKLKSANKNHQKSGTNKDEQDDFWSCTLAIESSRGVPKDQQQFQFLNQQQSSERLRNSERDENFDEQEFMKDLQDEMQIRNSTPSSIVKMGKSSGIHRPENNNNIHKSKGEINSRINQIETVQEQSEDG